MYERFFNLRERPFSLSPDPDYLYPSRVHREALSYIRYGMECRAGFVVVTGEIGCGKTTLLQTVLRGVDEHTSVSRLVNTILDPRELLEAIMLDFGLDASQSRSKAHLLHDLARFLVQQRAAGRLTLLVVDEAQNLSAPALEELRMLSNLETEKSKLIQILLVGQPSLRDALDMPELEQLRQRVTVSYHLHALDAGETAAYINHRLRRAALGTPMEFPRDVTDLIHLHSQGVPRKVNVISDAVLLFGYGEDKRVIDVALAKSVVEELESTGVIARPSFSSYSRPVAPPVRPSSRDREIATRAAADAEREKDEAQRSRLLQERWLADRPRPTVVPDPPASATSVRPPAEREWSPAGRERSTPLGLKATAPQTSGTDPYYRVQRQPQRATTLWSRMRRGWWGRANAVAGE